MFSIIPTLVFGPFLLLLLAGPVLWRFRNSPVVKDFIYRTLFVILALLPGFSLLTPRLTTITVAETNPVRHETEIEFPVGLTETPSLPETHETALPESFVQAAVQGEQIGRAESSTPEAATINDIQEDSREEVPLFIGRQEKVDDFTKAEAVRSPSRPLPSRRILFVFFWLAGVGSGFFLLLRNQALCSKILRNSARLENEPWSATIVELERRIGLKKTVRYRISGEIDVPQVVGILHPVVLLPNYLLAERPDRAILIHELSHIRRGDVFWQMLSSAVCIAYWFQPLVWIHAAGLRTIREEICDNEVIRLGERGSDYAETLLEMSSFIERGYGLGRLIPRRIGCAVTPPRSKNHVRRRILSLLDPNRKREPMSLKMKSWITLVLSAVALVSIALCPAWEKEDNNIGMSGKTDTERETLSIPSPEPLRTTETIYLEREPTVPGTDDDYVTDMQAIGVQRIPGLAVASCDVPFRGEVRLEDEGPVADAEIDVRFRDSSQIKLKSDARGRFLVWTCSEYALNRGAGIIARKTVGGELLLGVQKTAKDKNSYTIVLKKPVLITGTVVSGAGGPIEEFQVGTPEFGFEHFRGNGSFSLPIPADLRPTSLLACADGKGLDYRIFRNDKNRDESKDDPLYLDPGQAVEMKLTGAAPLTIQAIDTEGRGISGIEFELLRISYPPRMVGEELKIAPEISPSQSFRTGENGLARIDFFPAWARDQLMILPIEFRYGTNRYVRTKEFYPAADGRPILLVQEFIKTVPVSGTVRYPDGKPVVGLEIGATGQGIVMNAPWYNTKTDEEGRYRLRLPPYQWYVMAARPVEDWAFPMQDGFVVMPDRAMENFDIDMEPATKVTLKLLSDPERKTIPGRKLRIDFIGKSDQGIGRAGTEPVPTGFRMPIYRGFQETQYPMTVYGTVATDTDGTVTIPLGTGRYKYTLRDAKENDLFETTGVFEVRYDPDRPEIVREIPVQSREQSPFEGVVLKQDEKGKWVPAADVIISCGDPPRTFPGKSDKNNYRNVSRGTDQNGRFSFDRANSVMWVYAYDPRSKQAAYTVVPATEHEIELKLRPLVSVTGKLTNLETGEPVRDAKLEYCWRYEYGGDLGRVREAISIHRVARIIHAYMTTDEEGCFTIEALLPDAIYDLHLDRRTGPESSFDVWQLSGFRTPPDQTGRPFDIGVIQVPTSPDIGPRSLGAVHTNQAGREEASIVENLRQARRNSEPVYAWRRIGDYKNAVLGLIKLDRMDAAGVAAREMVQLVDSTRMALRARGLPCDIGRFDDDLYSIASAFREKGKNELAEEIRKHLEKIDDRETIRRKIRNCRIDELENLVRMIEDQFPEKERDELIYILFVDGCRDKASTEEMVRHARKLERPGPRIHLFFAYSDDYRTNGYAEQADELYDEAVELLIALPTPADRAPFWGYVLDREMRESGSPLLWRAALETYDGAMKSELEITVRKPEIDLEKTGYVSQEDRNQLNSYFGPILRYCYALSRPLQALVKIGEKEKAVLLATKIAGYKDVITLTELEACSSYGFIEGSLAAAADALASCGKTEQAKELWQTVLKMLAIGDTYRRLIVTRSVLSSMRGDFFKDEIRKLCLGPIKEMKTWDNPDNVEFELFVTTGAMVLYRNGFEEDAVRVLDEFSGELQENDRLNDDYRSNLAKGYASIHRPEKATIMAESIKDEQARERVFRIIRSKELWP